MDDKSCEPLLLLVEAFECRDNVHDVFGVVLYTEEHPYFVKVLRDEDFWRALNTKSGDRWAIFSIRPERGELVTRFPEAPPGMMQMMIPISEWKEPRENRRLLEALELENTSELPLLVVFAAGPDAELLRAVFKLSGRSEEECYGSLEKAIVAAANAIKDVTKDNIKNTTEVFNLMDAACRQEIFLARTKKVVAVGTWLKSLIKAFQGTV